MTDRVIIIAEAGVNHNGVIEKAIELIDVAADAGADFVKFQSFKAERLVNINAKKASYQLKNLKGEKDTQFEMLKKLEIGDDWYPALIHRCKEKGIQFLSTGFDEISIDLLDGLNIPFHKIPSGEITNKPFLQHIARTGKDIVLSTGMANLKEVKAALDVLYLEGIKKSQVTVLHCNTEYPTPMEDVNLLAMNQMAKDLKVKVGYSDHTLGIEVPIAAVALGARVIEKHFTLNRNLPGPDHAASLEPEELKSMVNAIRNIEKAISGNGFKQPSKSELKNVEIVRKSLHFRNDLPSGHVIDANDLIALRPGLGVNPMQIEMYIGKRLNQNVSAFSMIDYTHFVW
jgi:N-acetylneuraminate synthase/N,N'-diacetyllegionaminate synthase